MQHLHLVSDGFQSLEVVAAAGLGLKAKNLKADELRSPDVLHAHASTTCAALTVRDFGVHQLQKVSLTCGPVRNQMVSLVSLSFRPQVVQQRGWPGIEFQPSRLLLATLLLTCEVERATVRAAVRPEHPASGSVAQLGCSDLRLSPCRVPRLARCGAGRDGCSFACVTSLSSGGGHAGLTQGGSSLPTTTTPHPKPPRAR